MRRIPGYGRIILSAAVTLAGCSSGSPGGAGAGTPAAPPAPPGSAVPPQPATAGARGPAGSAVPPPPAAVSPVPPVPTVSAVVPVDLKQTPIQVATHCDVLYPATPGPFVAVGHSTTARGTCEVWDLSKEQRVGTLADLEPAKVFALSPDGRQFAAVLTGTMNPTVAVWSVATGQELRKIEVNPSPIFVDILLFVAPERLVTAKQTVKGRLFQIWDVTTGEAVREILGPQLFERDSAAASADGKLFAVFSDKSVLVYDLATGEKAAQLDTGNQPFSVMHCRGLGFAPDGSELAGVFYNNRETKLMSWNTGDRQLVVDHQLPGDVKLAIKGAFSYKGPALDWLPDGSAFVLYGHAVVDRNTGRLVWMIRPADEDIYPAARRVLDNDHVAVVTGAWLGERRVQILKLPWPQIDGSLKAMTSDAAAHLKPGQTISLEVTVADVRSGTPDQTKTDIVQALTERFAGDGIKVEPGAPVVLTVRYSEQTGATLHEVESKAGPGGVPMPPGPFGGNAVKTGRTVQGTKATCDVAFKLAGATTPFWSNRIEMDPKNLIVTEQPSAAAARSATFGMVKSSLLQQPIPYFVPKDASLAALPGSTQLPGSSATSPGGSGRATPKETRRGQQ